ncbi:MAG: Ig-like domain-containing protein [Chloroflexota bacterium]
MVVFGVGVVALVAVLWYASNVDGRPPAVQGFSLTHHLSADAEIALTTSSLEVEFSEPVQHADAERAITISPAIAGSFSWSSTTLTFTPAARLPLRTAFEVAIAAGIRDVAGNAMTAPPRPFDFETVGNPSVVASDPANADDGVPLDGTIQIDFSTLMDTASVGPAMRLTPGTDVTLRWARERLTIEPTAPLQPNRRYTLTIGTGAHDLAGTPLAAPVSLSFRTVASELSAEIIVPTPDVEGIATTSEIAVIFDRDLDAESLRDDLLTITPDVAGSLDVVAAPGAAGLRESGLRILRFQPSAPLEPNTTYEVIIGPGLLAADGAGLAAGLAWRFTTGSPTATLSNQVAFLSDRAGITNLWAMNPDGTNQRQLSAELSPITGYSIAPDGRSFVIGDGAVIVWQRADGSARRLLTDGGAIEYDPAYAPDGSSITYGRLDPILGDASLWRRDADGSDAQRIRLPGETTTTPNPTPSATSPVSLFRAPRLSPDGTALAFVDDAGRVVILDLVTEHLSAAPFIAFSEPVWQPDSSGVLLSGLARRSNAEPRLHAPGLPVPALDPASLQLDVQRLAGLRVVRLALGASIVEPAAFAGGATRPTIDGRGAVGFISLAGEANAGRLWVSADLRDAGEEFLARDGARARSASFAPEPGAILISRVADAEEGASSGGVWIVHLASGSARQLCPDGWQPRWLP